MILVSAYVAHYEPDPQDTVILGQASLYSDSFAAIRVLVRNHATGRPVQNAAVRLTIEGDKVKEDLGKYMTEEDGSISKAVYIPSVPSGRYNLVVESKSQIGKDHIVIPVPDTAKAAGDSMAYELGIPSKEGLIRNRFVGRTFIEGSSRQDRVQNKYTALKEILRDKKIILVDDSIVRGTTTKQIIRYLKKEGKAKEVHVRVSCPPIRGPCFYGIDMSTISELLVPQYEKKPFSGNIGKKICDKIAKDVAADSLIYQTVEGLVRSIGLPKNSLCTACITCDYPTLWGKKLFKKAWENRRKGVKGRTYAHTC